MRSAGRTGTRGAPARADRADATVLIVDNYDSFTYNLVDYASEHAATAVVRNTVSVGSVRAEDPDAVVVSPGPGHPANSRDVGVSRDVLLEVSPEGPTLGICLGLEAAVCAYGGAVGRAPAPVPGKTSPIEHDGRGVFAGLPQGFPAARYHSLVATEVPDCFLVTATADAGGDDLVMGLRHREHPIECVQFHPESVLTAVGRDLVENFLALAGIAVE